RAQTGYRCREPHLLSGLISFFHHPPPPYLYTLSLHDALPISSHVTDVPAPELTRFSRSPVFGVTATPPALGSCHQNMPPGLTGIDRKSTRLNSSHVKISYAVFCLKKKMN